MSIKLITDLFNVIDRELFTINSKQSYETTLNLIIKLANLVDEFPASDDGYELWSIGEFGVCSLDNLLVGAYWFSADCHDGQSSTCYAMGCAVGQVFSPGMGSGPEPDTMEESAYQALVAKHNEFNKHQIELENGNDFE